MDKVSPYKLNLYFFRLTAQTRSSRISTINRMIFKIKSEEQFFGDLLAPMDWEEQK